MCDLAHYMLENRQMINIHAFGALAKISNLAATLNKNNG